MWQIWLDSLRYSSGPRQSSAPGKNEAHGDVRRRHREYGHVSRDIRPEALRSAFSRDGTVGLTLFQSAAKKSRNVPRAEDYDRVQEEECRKDGRNQHGQWRRMHDESLHDFAPIGLRTAAVLHARFLERFVDATLPAGARGAEALQHVAVEAQRHLLLRRRLLRAALSTAANQLGQIGKMIERLEVAKVFGGEFAHFTFLVSERLSFLHIFESLFYLPCEG